MVPVVFHVVHNTLSENISEAQILSQLDILNQDFGDSMRIRTTFGHKRRTRIEFVSRGDPEGSHRWNRPSGDGVTGLVLTP